MTQKNQIWSWFNRSRQFFPSFNTSGPKTFFIQIHDSGQSFIYNDTVAIPIAIGWIETKRIDRVLTLIVWRAIRKLWWLAQRILCIRLRMKQIRFQQRILQDQWRASIQKIQNFALHLKRKSQNFGPIDEKNWWSGRPWCLVIISPEAYFRWILSSDKEVWNCLKKNWEYENWWEHKTKMRNQSLFQSKAWSKYFGIYFL